MDIIDFLTVVEYFDHPLIMIFHVIQNIEHYIPFLGKQKKRVLKRTWGSMHKSSKSSVAVYQNP